MNYPSGEFLADFERISNPIIPLSMLPDDQKSQLIHAFFQNQYQDSGMATEREHFFRKIMALIWNSQKELSDAGVIVARPAKYGMLFPLSLAAVLHDLVVTQCIEQPTIEQAIESMRKLGWDGKPIA